MTTIIPDLIKQDWNSRGYSFGVFRDPPGQVGLTLSIRTDELVVLAEGEIRGGDRRKSGEISNR
ncbi:MAG: hypothetical protein CM15mP45_17470 [Deltaproteobacteria bacterium]|nr:MAG: hypothetical protein CM15mP45_17470 [Deltaproteobacteria bacterium]